MILNNLKDIQSKHFHTIIIGSGPAGISTALELEKKKIECLILEAGPFSRPTENDLSFLKGDVIGDDYNDLAYTRLRQFGGTSGHWGGSCNLFDDSELKEWPLKKIDLEFNLELAKNILEIKENFLIKDFSGDFYQTILRNSPVKFADKYYHHISNSKYISLSCDTIFTDFIGEIKKGESNGKINLIRCFNKDYYKLRAKYFVLSCGGIENSRMLLWSKNKNAELFKLQSQIGHYYMDHPWQKVAEGLLNYSQLIAYYKKMKIRNDDILNCVSYPNIYFSLKKNFREKHNILNCGLYLSLNDQIPKDFLYKLTCVAPEYVKNIFNKFDNKNIYHVDLFLHQEQEPIFDNFITLSNKLDPLGIPLSNLHWKKSDLLRKTAKISTSYFAKFFAEKDIGRLSLNEYLFNNNEYKTQVGYHQMGGTRIGYSFKDSVVDKNLKVHGVSNLFVNGSSVFRTSGHAHPTCTIVLLALRLGQHLSSL